VADDIIDLTRYLDGGPHSPPEEEESRGFFSIWGGEGERSRFALPLWRSAYLVGGKRGAIIRIDSTRSESPRPLFVLDLGAEPARIDFGHFEPPEAARLSDAPLVQEEREHVLVYLGTEEDESWFILLDGRDPDADAVKGKTREDLLFLAGECAGLIFYQKLAEDPDG